MALWEILEGLQRQEDEESYSFYLEHPEYGPDDEVFGLRREFMNELFDRGEVEIFANVFRFYHPEFFVLDHRVLDILGPEEHRKLRGKEHMCWGYPHVSILEGRLCVEVMLIDRDGE